ncbi:MAG: hypothetical protein M2R45_02916 [Verrucomicrobia subdivision 3 bacterium]|nr:hypothetical protein [Limisphaerales bacterium]MCS1415362.1 hypothetical protein [Limisphaerales bacterium]
MSSSIACGNDNFGQGILNTPNDFGKLSGGPSHPELLDWLTEQLIEEKWRLKAIHRLILTSRTYRQASQVTDPKAEQTDPNNHPLW